MKKKEVDNIRIPTEKQITLLERLMNHELEEVQKKALTVVLFIWKKKTIKEIASIVPELNEKQIRYTIKKYRESPTDYLESLYSRWSRKRVIHELRSSYDRWAKTHQHKKPFDLSIRGFFNRYNKPLLYQLQNLSKNKLFLSVHDAYAEAGINPNCHLKPSYGAQNDEKIEKWIEVIKVVADTYGDRILSSEYMNPLDQSDQKYIKIPKTVKYPGDDFPLSEAQKTRELRISLVSIQQNGIKLFESKKIKTFEECWQIAVESAGFNYFEIKKRIANSNRKKFVNMFLDFLIERKFKWTIKDLTNPQYDYIGYFYRGIKSTWKDSEYREFAHKEDFLLGSLIEAFYSHEESTLSPFEYYSENVERISKIIYNDSSLAEGYRFDSMLQNIFRRYSNGDRITRKYLEENDQNDFLEEASVLGKKNYANFLNVVGIPHNEIQSLYHDELDDPWKIEVIYENIQRLVVESFNNSENRLLGKYASINEKPLYNAICSKYGLWTSGLLKVGIDLKVFTKQINNKKSLETSYHSFISSMLKRYDFLELEDPKKLKREDQFSDYKSFKKCTPEFLFWDKIILSRVGYHPNDPVEDLDTYKKITGMIIIITLDGKKEITSGETTIIRIPFHQFIKESKSLIGKQLRYLEVEKLSVKLKRKSFWDK